MKRDLKADLELCNGFAEMLGEETLEDAITEAMGQSFSEFKKGTFATHALTGWPHAIEKAMKAEALNRELVEALEEAIWLLEGYTGRHEDIERLKKELIKAKEVLGDE